MAEEILRATWSESQANRLAASVERAPVPAAALEASAQAYGGESDLRTLSAATPSEVKELAVEAVYAVAAAAEEVGEGVLATPRHPAGSLLQSFLERKARAEGLPLEADNCGELWVKFSTSDFDRWAAEYLENLVRRILKGKHSGLFADAEDAVIEDLPEGRVVLVSDWGTGRYGAKELRGDLTALGGSIGLCAHLGDVYYSGEPDEVKERFEPYWPQIQGCVSRAINANHEMYSGGFGFFDRILPAFKQQSSYFAYGTDDWVLVFLDTGYKDHDLRLASNFKPALRHRQVNWLNKIVELAEKRRVVLFTHHQLFDPWDGGGGRLLSAIKGLLEAKRIYGWYWGHQHHATIFEPHPDYALRARCIGHGGMPYGRRSELAMQPAVHTSGEYRWCQLGARKAAPGCITLDGPNAFVCDREDDFGPNGFVTLELNGAKCVETFYVSGVADPVWQGEL